MKDSHAVYISVCLQEHSSWASQHDQPWLGVKGVLIPGLMVLGGLPNPVLNVEPQEPQPIHLF